MPIQALRHLLILTRSSSLPPSASPIPLLRCRSSVYTAGYFRNNSSMSGYSADYVNQKLAQNLQTTHLDVVDVSDGCGAKFECVIVSPLFDGKAILERHRMVNDVLSEELKSIHAFSMRTLTPDQWSKLQSKG